MCVQLFYQLYVLMFYVYTFQNNELSELWMRYGTRKAQRFIPIHALYGSLRHTKSLFILKAHIATGCDVTANYEQRIEACPDYLTSMSRLFSTFWFLCLMRKFD